MSLLRAIPAERMPAPAADIVVLAAYIETNDELASAGRAPLSLLIVLDIRSNKIARVLLFILFTHQRVDHLLTNGGRAPRIRAPQAQAGRPVADRRADVSSPALATELMAAICRAHLAAKMTVETNLADGFIRGDRSGGFDQANGIPNLGLVGEPLVVDLGDVPIVVAEQQTGIGFGDREGGRQLTHVVVLESSYVGLGQDGVVLHAIRAGFAVAIRCDDGEAVSVLVCVCFSVVAE